MEDITCTDCGKNTAELLDELLELPVEQRPAKVDTLIAVCQSCENCDRDLRLYLKLGLNVWPEYRSDMPLREQIEYYVARRLQWLDQVEAQAAEFESLWPTEKFMQLSPGPLRVLNRFARDVELGVSPEHLERYIRELDRVVDLLVERFGPAPIEMLFGFSPEDFKRIWALVINRIAYKE